MTTGDRRVAATAKGQLGAFTRAQAHDAQLTARQLRRRVQSGFLEKVGANTYRSPSIDADARADLLALLLDIGEPCWASGPTAAALHGYDGFPLRPPFHVTILRGRDVSRVGHHIHTTTELPLIDRARVDGLTVTSGARTVIDLARHCGPEALAAAIDSGLRDGKFNESLLHRRIAALRTKGRHGIPSLLAVIEGAEITRGGHSWLEREFLRLVARAGLPRPETQQTLARTGSRLVRVDARFAGTNVVVELLGYRFHRTKVELQHDAERCNALILRGLLPFQFTYDHVVSHSVWLIATLTEALRRSVSA